MEMTPVQSSLILSVGYEDGTLAIRFASGKTYEFTGVPESTFTGLMNSPSKGRYFLDRIKGRFPEA